MCAYISQNTLNTTHYSLFHPGRGKFLLDEIGCGGTFLRYFLTIFFLSTRTKTYDLRLQARDFYEMIVNEGEVRINYHFL